LKLRSNSRTPTRTPTRTLNYPALPPARSFAALRMTSPWFFLSWSSYLVILSESAHSTGDLEWIFSQECNFLGSAHLMWTDSVRMTRQAVRDYTEPSLNSKAPPFAKRSPPTPELRSNSPFAKRSPPPHPNCEAIPPSRSEAPPHPNCEAIPPTHPHSHPHPHRIRVGFLRGVRVCGGRRWSPSS
jgi:hypothetical protein